MPLSTFPAFSLAAYLASVSIKYIRQDDRLRTGDDLSGMFGYRLSRGLGIQGGHIIGSGLAGIPNPMTVRQSFRVWFLGWTLGGVLV